MSNQMTPKTKSRYIAAALRQKIRSRRLPSGTPLPSARELAEKYHVCMMTANRALDLLEKDSLIQRKNGIGNFVRKNIFQGNRLQLGIADTIGHPSASARQILIDIFPETAIRYLKSENCDCRLISYADFRNGDSASLEGLNALLLSSDFIDATTERFIRSLKLPVVIYHSEFEIDFPCPQVIPDHSVAMDKLFELARQESFSGILIFCQPHRNGLARAEAFDFFARKHGFPAEQIRRIELNYLELRRKLLPLIPEIPGKLVITCSDLMTFELIEILGECSLVCGRNYQLVSYDNLNKVMQMPPGIPEVTSIDYSRTGAARTAAKLLIMVARNPKLICYQTIKFPTQLIIRESAFRTGKEPLS